VSASPASQAIHLPGQPFMDEAAAGVVGEIREVVT
jgi:hypothetical protein